MTKIYCFHTNIIYDHSQKKDVDEAVEKLLLAKLDNPEHLILHGKQGYDNTLDLLVETPQDKFLLKTVDETNEYVALRENFGMAVGMQITQVHLTGMQADEVATLQFNLLGRYTTLSDFSFDEDVEGYMALLSKKHGFWFWKSYDYDLRAQVLSSKDVMKLAKMYQSMQKSGKLQRANIHFDKRR